MLDYIYIRLTSVLVFVTVESHKMTIHHGVQQPCLGGITKHDKSEDTALSRILREGNKINK